MSWVIQLDLQDYDPGDWMFKGGYAPVRTWLTDYPGRPNDKELTWSANPEIAKRFRTKEAAMSFAVVLKLKGDEKWDPWTMRPVKV